MSRYYEILGVDEDATEEEIKKAFINKVKKTHPDHNDHPNAAQQFQQLKEAYDVLRDPESREQYDSDGTATGGGQAGTGPDGSDKTTSSDATHWKDNIRGSPEAEYIWENKTDRVGEPAPPTSTGDRQSLQRILGYFISGAAPFGLGLILSVHAYGIFILQGPGLISGSSFSVVALSMTITMIVCIYAAEMILQTDRRMPFS